MPDPDLQIRGGGHPEPLIRGEGERSTKNFFWSFGPKFDLKIWGTTPQALLLDPPLNTSKDKPTTVVMKEILKFSLQREDRDLASQQVRRV